MELKQTNLKFQGVGLIKGLDRTDHQYGVSTRQTTGGECKNARFDFLYDTDKSLKMQINIRGYVQDKARGWDRENNKLITVPWDDRFNYEDDQNMFIFPQPYDAASNIEFAENDEKYYISGDVRPRYYDNDGKVTMYTDYYAVEATPADENKDCYMRLKGDFVYTGVSGNRLTGCLIDYKKNIYPISFYWNGHADVLKDIEEQIPYGSVCTVTNCYMGMIPAAPTSNSRRSFGESYASFDRKVMGYILNGLDVKNTESYSKEDLTPKSSDGEEDIFEV